jgi:hypothetical protein
VCASFVRVEPAGVQVAEEEGLVMGLTLVFVCLPHDEILNVGERVMLVEVRGLPEWVVLLEVVDHVCM